MSRKHNTKHRRTSGAYERRLRAMGATSGSVTMNDYVRCGIGQAPSAHDRAMVDAIRHHRSLPVEMVEQEDAA